MITHKHNPEAVFVIQQVHGTSVVRQFGKLASVCRTNMAAGTAVITMSNKQLHHFFTQVVSQQMLQLHNVQHQHSSI